MKLNRRNFLFGSAAAMTLAGCSTAKTGLRPLKEGEKRAVAIIGLGMQGRTLRDQFLRQSSIRVTACCDCDLDRLEAFAKSVNGWYKDSACRTFTDFRDVIRDPEIDAVVIATPDHWHAYMSVEAMKHGKDVYCEKPLTFNVDEARKVIAAQAKYGRVFQAGSMQRSWDVFRTACMVVRNGCIGDVMYVDANYGIGGQKLGGPSHPVRFWDEPDKIGIATNNRSQGIAKRTTDKDHGPLFRESDPNPKCDWDMWLGPAKWRPYSDQLAPRGDHGFYPMFWRFDDDFGTGYNGDWGAHHLDIAQWGLDMDHSGPFRIIRSEEPYSSNLYHGGRRQFGMKMLFHKPYGDVELYHGPFGVWGTVFYGTKGIVAVNRGKIAVWLTPGLVKPTPEVRKQLADATFNGRPLYASIGKDYGTDATVKKDNRLARTLEDIKKYFNLDTAPVQLYKSPNQVQNFCECIETRALTISPSEVGARGSILCSLCNLSYVYDTGFDWDPVANDFANGTGKGIPLKRDFCRNGWEVVV